MSSPLIEPLEGRRLCSTSPIMFPPQFMMMMPQLQQQIAAPAKAASPKAGRFVISFYGLGGAGSSFGQDWLDKAADSAGSSKRARVRKYNESDTNTAVSELFSSLDKNADHIIDATEAKKANVRVIGYSFGGVAATNFSRELNRAGETVQGYQLNTVVKVKSLVTLDPVNHNGRHTDGVPSNVNRFYNYYQLHGGTTTVDAYIKVFGAKIHVRTITVDDPSDIKGDVLPSEAVHTSQVRVDTRFADDSVSHKIVDQGVYGRIKGKNINHGTLPFFVLGLASDKLKK